MALTGCVWIANRPDEAPLGTAVCLEGGTTGQSCGFVTRQNRVETLPFEEGFFIVNRRIVGMREATLCSRGGDSGGPVLQLNQAQGTLVAGLGDCGDPGPTPSLYQPIKPVLLQYGLALIGTPESVTPAPLRISSLDCDRETTGPGWVCYASWTGGVDPATASWRVYHPRPTPYVITNPANRVTEAHFACFFNEAEPDYPVQVTIRDAVGAEASRSAHVCLW